MKIENLKFQYFFWGAFFIFITGVVSGIVVVYSMHDQDWLESSEILVNNKVGFEASLGIFMRNIGVAVILASGLLLFGLPTLIVLFINGLWIGTVIASRLAEGVSLATLLLKLLPHGVFELPALLLAGAIGLKGFVFYYEPKKGWRLYFRLTGWIILMLLVAALIEGFVTSVV
ncbi:stage II sporulation protein M [Paenibacillus sp. FSL H8-0537]|uniref:stage II sporulation protein M n=1 Tax=Paenibacillus sp. FSL H8-0537 TaxID=2921399 RepID=UPI003100EFAB